MADNVLKIGALVDVETIRDGMAEGVSIVGGSTDQMSLSFKELADVTVNSDETMIAGMAQLTEAITVLTTAIGEIPARAVPALQETEGAVASLQARLVGAAETAKLSASGIGGAFSGLGVLLGAGLAGNFLLHFIDQTEEAVLEMDHLSQRTGLTIETVAGLKYAADAVGISLDAVSTGMTRLLRAQELAIQGGKGQIQAFHDIGLSVSQIKNLNPGQLFFTVGEALAKTTSSADATTAAIGLLGKGGAALIPLFKEYGDQLQVVVDEHGKLSLVTKDAAESALKYKQILADLSETIRSMMIPVMQDAVAEMKNTEYDWIKLSAVGESAFLWMQAGAENLVTAMMAVASAEKAILTGSFSEAPKIIAAANAQVDANVEATGKHYEQVWTDANAKLKALMAKPLDVPLPTGPDQPQANKLTGDKGQKALLDAQLKEQLAAIDAEKAAQHLAYAEGKIDLDAWIAAQTAADTQAYAAHEAYFTKLKALFANNPTKLAAVGAEQLDYEYKTAAKSTDDLASETEKLNKELLKMGEQAAKNQEKEMDAGLKAVTKSTLEYLKANQELQKSIAESTPTGWITQTQEMEAAEDGLISKVQQLQDKLAQPGNSNNLAFKTELEEAQSQLAILQGKLEPFRATWDSTWRELGVDAQNSILQISNQFTTGISRWITGQQTFLQSVQQIWQTLVSDVVSSILKIGEKLILEHVVMTAAVKIFHVQDVAATAAAEAQKAAVAKVAQIQLVAQQAAATTALDASYASSVIAFTSSETAKAAAALSSQATKSAINVAEATSDAAVAAGGQFAFYSATDPLIAPAMAAAAYAEGLTFAGLAAFEKGGISEGGLALLHPKEMVLPSDLSEGVQDMVSSGGSGSGGSGGDIYHVHVHMPEIHVNDATGVDAMLGKHSKTIAKSVQKSLRSGHINLRGAF